MAALGVGVLTVLASACSSGGPSTTTTTTTTTTTSNPDTTVPGLPTTSTTDHARRHRSVRRAQCGRLGEDGLVRGRSPGGRAAVRQQRFDELRPLRVSRAAGLNASGAQVVQAQRTLTGMMGGLAPGVTALPRITLAPGQTASAVVEGTDVPSGTETSCPTYPSLLVTAPNAKASVTIPFALPGCSGLQVHPVVPGTSGSTQF